MEEINSREISSIVERLMSFCREDTSNPELLGALNRVENRGESSDDTSSTRYGYEMQIDYGDGELRQTLLNYFRELGRDRALVFSWPGSPRDYSQYIGVWVNDGENVSDIQSFLERIPRSSFDSPIVVEVIKRD